MPRLQRRWRTHTVMNRQMRKISFESSFKQSQSKTVQNGWWKRVIEKRPITPKPLQIGVPFLLTTNRKSLVCFQNMRSDLKFGGP